MRLTSEDLTALIAKAHHAGMMAGGSVIPTPMVVMERANPLDDKSPIVHEYEPVMDGPCGFATVRIRPGNCAVAKFLLANAEKLTGCRAYKDSYAGGVAMSVWHFNQSMTRKERYASAFAEVIRAIGVKAFSESRMD